MQYVWITWSIFILVVWLVLYITRHDFRKVMLGMSLITMPLGLLVQSVRTPLLEEVEES